MNETPEKLATATLRPGDTQEAKILIVDDEPANVKLLERMLQSFGYRNLVSTTDARTVLGLFRQQDSELLKMAHIIALNHHEKWDGSGYPVGLEKEQIPLVGRITALTDVFDALTSVRPYKKAWTVEAAIEYIDDNRGKHFDPRLVDAFRERLDVMLAIKDKFAEPVVPEH